MIPPHLSHQIGLYLSLFKQHDCTPPKGGELSEYTVRVHTDVDDPSSRCMKEGNVLFNDALNTFYLRLYGVRHMVKDRSDIERGNLLPPHRLLRLAARIILYVSSHRQDNTYHSLLLHQTWSTGWYEKYV